MCVYVSVLMTILLNVTRHYVEVCLRDMYTYISTIYYSSVILNDVDIIDIMSLSQSNERIALLLI